MHWEVEGVNWECYREWATIWLKQIDKCFLIEQKVYKIEIAWGNSSFSFIGIWYIVDGHNITFYSVMNMITIKISWNVPHI